MVGMASDTTTHATPPVTPAAPADLEAAAWLLACAFTEDRPLRAIFRSRGPVEPARSAPVFRALLREGPLRCGTVDVVRDAGGDVVAVAVWHAPAAGRTSLLGHLPLAGTYVRALGLEGTFRAARITGAVQAYHPRVPHWYLETIGVAPSARGQGLGSALLAHRLAAVDAQDVPAYLESSSRRSGTLYQRHGFAPLRRITVWPGAEPWSMWRERGSLRRA